MKKIKQHLPYLLVILICFYLLPLLIRDTGSAMLLLLVIFPIICLVLGVIYRAKNATIGLFPIAVGVIFLPSVFVFYNFSALIYSLIYALLALLGCFSGKLFNKNSEQ